MTHQTIWANQSRFPIVATLIRFRERTSTQWDVVYMREQADQTTEVKVAPLPLFDVEYLAFETLTQILEGEIQSKTTWIKTLDDSRLVLKSAIPITLSFGPESVTASWDEVNHYGVGEDELSALADLKVVIVEAYFQLKEFESKLGPEPKRQLALLRLVIED